LESDFIAWNFFLAIYKSGWNKLVANKEQKSFRQGVSMLSQISYSLVVILKLSGVLEVQYKKIMMNSINKNN